MPTEANPKRPPRTFFAARYFQALVQDLRRPGSEAEPWLVDALALLVERAEEFPPPDDAESYVVEYYYPH